MSVQVTIYIRPFNVKTTRMWAKRVKGVDLDAQGGFALLGEWLPLEPFEEVSVPLTEGDIIVVGHNGGSWKNRERWASVLRAAPGASEEDAGGESYGKLGVTNAECLFLASDYDSAKLASLATEWGYSLEQVRKAKKNPNYAAALFIDHLLKERGEGGDANETVREVL